MAAMATKSQNAKPGMASPVEDEGNEENDEHYQSENSDSHYRPAKHHSPRHDRLPVEVAPEKDGMEQCADAEID